MYSQGVITSIPWFGKWLAAEYQGEPTPRAIQCHRDMIILYIHAWLMIPFYCQPPSSMLILEKIALINHQVHKNNKLILELWTLATWHNHQPFWTLLNPSQSFSTHVLYSKGKLLLLLGMCQPLRFTTIPQLCCCLRASHLPKRWAPRPWTVLHGSRWWMAPKQT